MERLASNVYERARITRSDEAQMFSCLSLLSKRVHAASVY
jgi:hypothetical protein